MSDETSPQPTAKAARQGQRFRLAAFAILLVGGLIAWLALRDRGGSSSSKSTAAAAVSVKQIKDLAASLHQPIYWLGPRTGYTYELARASNGNIYIRYLPPGVAVGTSTPELTVGTYPFRGALAAIERVLKNAGITRVDAPNGGVGEFPVSNPRSVHVAYPGSDYQLEVFAASPATVRKLITTGRLRTIG